MMREKTFAVIGLLAIWTVIFAAGPEVVAQSKRDLERAKKVAAEGDILFRQKDYRSAITRYAQAVTLAPNFPHAHFWKGYAHYYVNDYTQSLSELNTAFDQGYTPLEVFKLRWFLHYQKGDHDLALQDAQAGLNLDPSNAYFLLALGDIYRAQKNYRNAMLAYKRALEKNPEQADVYYYVAESHFFLGDSLDQGLAALEAIKKGTKFPGEAWFYVGDAFQKSKKYDQAIEAYERAVTANPKIYGAYSNLAEIYRNQGRFDDAIKSVNRGLVQYPDDGNYYISLSWYYSLADKHNDAVRAGQKAIELAPDNYMGFTNLCRAYNDTRLYPLAIKTCLDALRLNPGDGESNFYLARAYDLSNKPELATPFYKKAVTGMEEFIRNNPDYSDGYYLLGNAYYADGQPDKAIGAYRKTLQLSPNFSKARYNLGYLLFLQKDLPGAREQVDALMRIDPDLADKLKQTISN